MIIIVGCGKSKLKSRSRADELYQGSLFKKRISLARTITTDDQIFILSAKYGLVSVDQLIDPYELKMGQRGSITARMLSLQAKRLNIRGTIGILASGPYIIMAQQVFDNVKIITPPHLGIGKQMQWLDRQMKNRP